jgi:hypothetical protein
MMIDQPHAGTTPTSGWHVPHLSTGSDCNLCYKHVTVFLNRPGNVEVGGTGVEAGGTGVEA